MYREISAPRYSDGAAHFDMGEHTLRVPMSHHSHNRSRLVARLAELRSSASLKAGSVVILQGGDELPRDATDCSWAFRQVRLTL